LNQIEIPSAEPGEKCEKATMKCFVNYLTSISAELNHEGTALETRVCLHRIEQDILQMPTANDTISWIPHSAKPSGIYFCR